MLKRNKFEPWLVWPSVRSTSLRTEGFTSQGTRLGCRPGTQRGNHTLFLYLSFFLLLLSKNK